MKTLFALIFSAACLSGAWGDDMIRLQTRVACPQGLALKVVVKEAVLVPPFENNPEKVFQAVRLYRTAREFYEARKYDLARECCGMVLRIDSNNKAAGELMRKISNATSHRAGRWGYQTDDFDTKHEQVLRGVDPL